MRADMRVGACVHLSRQSLSKLAAWLRLHGRAAAGEADEGMCGGHVGIVGHVLAELDEERGLLRLHLRLQRAAAAAAAAPHTTNAATPLRLRRL